MNLKIAICDDDASQRAYLIDILTPWSKKNRHLIELKEYPGAKSFLFDYAQEKDFDVSALHYLIKPVDGGKRRKHAVR